MNWQTPSYDEIKMDAEIGSYQEDSDIPRDDDGRYGRKERSSPEPLAPHAAR